MWLLIMLTVLGCGVYWFKVRADSIESDCEDMVEPGSRQPYGQWVWTIAQGRSKD